MKIFSVDLSEKIVIYSYIWTSVIPRFHVFSMFRICKINKSGMSFSSRHFRILISLMTWTAISHPSLVGAKIRDLR